MTYKTFTRTCILITFSLTTGIYISSTTSSCARSARFATGAKSSLRSLRHCGASASLASTQHIILYKIVSEHYPDCNGNSSANVQGRRQLNLLLSGLCNTTLIYLHVIYMTVVIHTRMRITGRFKDYFLSVHMANLSATG